MDDKKSDKTPKNEKAAQLRARPSDARSVGGNRDEEKRERQRKPHLEARTPGAASESPARLPRKPQAEQPPLRFKAAERYRVEGIGRRGAVRYVKVVGAPGLWRITGMGDLRLEVPGRTVAEALKRAGRRIPFKPIVIRAIENVRLQEI